MLVNEEILSYNCNADCPRYVAGNCPFMPSEKSDCPRVREYMQAIYNLSIPKDWGLTAKEFLEDVRLAGITWKHIITFRFNDISYDAFEDAIKIIGNVEDS